MSRRSDQGKPKGKLGPLLAIPVLTAVLVAATLMGVDPAAAKPEYGGSCTSCHTGGIPGHKPAPSPKPKASPSKPGQPQGPAPAGKAVPAKDTVTVQVSINGKAREVPACWDNGRLLLPARTVAHWFGAMVDWNNRQKTATFTAGNRQITFLTRTGQARVDGKEVTARSRLQDNTTWVPIRFLAESLGATVEYNPDRGLLITTGPPAPSAAKPQSGPGAKMPTQATVDHSQFLTGPYANGPEVTAACLRCHQEEGREMLASEHWKWQGPVTDVVGLKGAPELGKGNGSINNL